MVRLVIEQRMKEGTGLRIREQVGWRQIKAACGSRNRLVSWAAFFTLMVF